MQALEIIVKILQWLVNGINKIDFSDPQSIGQGCAAWIIKFIVKAAVIYFALFYSLVFARTAIILYGNIIFSSLLGFFGLLIARKISVSKDIVQIQKKLALYAMLIVILGGLGFFGGDLAKSYLKNPSNSSYIKSLNSI